MLDALAAKSTLIKAEPTSEDWYANLFWIDGKKCVLLVHAGTLYSALTLNVRVGDLRPPGDFVFAQIVRTLDAEGLPRDVLGALDPHDVRLARTCDRSVLGSMNDIALMVKHVANAAGGLASCDGRELHRFLHGTPSGARSFATPLELVRHRLVAISDEGLGQWQRSRSASQSQKGVDRARRYFGAEWDLRP